MTTYLTPKVSVIIPVYNTELYIEETLQSIINQTFNEIEIIVINDGSTDNSLAVINNIASLDLRIRVFSQLNKGLSETRNTGIELALGEYIYFMDSDDLLENDALEKCYYHCNDNHLDFTFFDAEIFYDKRDNTNLLNINYNRSGMIRGNVFINLEIFKNLVKKNLFRASACLIFTNLNFLKKNNLRFYPGILHEDELFTPILFIEADLIGYIPEPLFKRRVRSGSIMTNKFSMQNISGYFIVAKQLLNHIQNKNTEVQNVIHLLIKNTLNAAIYKCSALPILDRIKITLICFQSFGNYITFRTYMILLFKKYIR